MKKIEPQRTARYYYLKFIRLKGDPAMLARGVAVGVFIGITPYETMEKGKDFNLLKNIELNRGIIYSQKLMTKLMDKGLPRIRAYDIVQGIALKVINKNSSFKKESLSNAKVKKLLAKQELEDIFNPYAYLSNVNKIYKRVGIA